MKIEWKCFGTECLCDSKDILTEDMFCPANVKRLPEIKECEVDENDRT